MVVIRIKAVDLLVDHLQDLILVEIIQIGTVATRQVEVRIFVIVYALESIQNLRVPIVYFAVLTPQLTLES